MLPQKLLPNSHVQVQVPQNAQAWSSKDQARFDLCFHLQALTVVGSLSPRLQVVHEATIQVHSTKNFPNNHSPSADLTGLTNWPKSSPCARISTSQLSPLHHMDPRSVSSKRWRNHFHLTIRPQSPPHARKSTAQSPPLHYMGPTAISLNPDASTDWPKTSPRVRISTSKSSPLHYMDPKAVSLKSSGVSKQASLTIWPQSSPRVRTLMAQSSPLHYMVPTAISLNQPCSNVLHFSTAEHRNQQHLIKRNERDLDLSGKCFLPDDISNLFGDPTCAEDDDNFDPPDWLLEAIEEVAASVQPPPLPPQVQFGTNESYIQFNTNLLKENDSDLSKVIDSNHHTSLAFGAEFWLIEDLQKIFREHSNCPFFECLHQRGMDYIFHCNFTKSERMAELDQQIEQGNH